MKKNEKRQVVLAMFRCNPQIGNYCTIRIADVVKTTKTSIQIDFYGTCKSFDAFGNEKRKSKVSYGDALYRIFGKEAAKLLFDGEKFNGYRISEGKKILESISFECEM